MPLSPVNYLLVADILYLQNLHLHKPQIFLLLTGSLAMGLSDWLRNQEDNSASTVNDSITDGGSEALFPEDDSDGFDLGEPEELEELDNRLGDLDDGSGGMTELGTRVSSLEDELEGITSTVNTVRHENEEISDSVQDIEENVRKLLDIYEMVTQGVNPFVDSVQEDASQSGTFGILNSDESSQDETEWVNRELAEASPESFFDDDFEDEPPVIDEEQAPGNNEDDSAVEPDDSPVSDETKTFEDLKAEYETDTGGWTERTPTAGPINDISHPDSPGSYQAPPEQLDDASDRCADDHNRSNSESVSHSETNRDQPATGATPSPPPGSSGGTGNDNPYLGELPSGYVTEFLIMEWLEYLVERGGLMSTTKLIQYYESIDWISPGVAADLRTVLGGFQANGHSEDHREFTIEDHFRSLKYIRGLTGTSLSPTDGPAPQLDEWLWLGAMEGTHGFQR